MADTADHSRELNLSLTGSVAWYEDVTDEGITPVAMGMAVWQLLSAALMFMYMTCMQIIRLGRRPTTIVTSHFVLLLAISGVFVKLPLIHKNNMMNPFTWRADVIFCRFHVSINQYIISALPFVIMTIAIDALLWVRDPVWYVNKVTSVPARSASMLIPWLVAVVVTLGVVLHVMPEGGRLISGRCIPAFDTNRVATFVIVILLLRFTLPLLGIIIISILLICSWRQKLRQQTTPGPGTLERLDIHHTCISIVVMSVLYIAMVSPHYFQLVFLQIPGIINAKNFKDFAYTGTILLTINEAFWNILPFIWVSLQPEIVPLIHNMSCSRRRVTRRPSEAEIMLNAVHRDSCKSSTCTCKV